MKKLTHLKKLLPFLPLASMLFPLAASAISEDAFSILAYLINATVLSLIGVATMIFMYGVIQYVIAKGDEKALASGRSYMLYGIIGLTVMVAVWGFVNLIIYTLFGADTGLSSPSVTPLQGTSRPGGGGAGSQICILGICF